MKVLILLGILTTGSMFLLPFQKDLAGTWVLDTSGKNCESAVLRIRMAEGYFTGVLDIPEQELYDQPVTIETKNEKIKILLDRNGTCFIDGVLSDSLIVGRS